jgi:heme-degrading monooxygenase HmoA
MVLEMAVLKIRDGEEMRFEAAFRAAQEILQTATGCLGHQLQHCLEVPGQYLLLVQWRELEDHTVHFRGSAPYQRWKELLHHFYDPFPTVQHYRPVAP